jgi:hypothetical protein
MALILTIYTESLKKKNIFLSKTIFDYNVFQEELHKLNVLNKREDYATEVCNMTKLYHTYILMRLRGDAGEANKILHEMYNYFTK